MRNVLYALVSIILAAGYTVEASAHGGGLDSLGCHHTRMMGGYHCHRGPLAGRDFGSKAEAQDALKTIQGGSQTQPLLVPPAASTIIGRASVIDGDTIEIRGQRIRFFGIDAPESGQTCHDGNGQSYRCGQHAALARADKVGQKTVECDQRDVDRYRRIVAVCRVGSDDLNAWLVWEGWAVAYRQYSKDYVQAEEDAKAAKRGLWAGEFSQPEVWRRSER